MPDQKYNPKTVKKVNYKDNQTSSDLDKDNKQTSDKSSAEKTNPQTNKNDQEYGGILTLGSGQRISPKDPNYDIYAEQLGVNRNNQGIGENIDETASQPNQKAQPDPKTTQKDTLGQADGVEELLASGRPFTETDAKNYAYALGESNWQKYVDASGGQENPLYIGSNNWSKLQKKYTPHQIEQATIRTDNGIYWNENINIAEVPRKDPAEEINDDAENIANIISDAKSEADPIFGTEDKGTKADGTGDTPDLSEDTGEDTEGTMKMLQGLYGDSAEDLYNELYNTEEITGAKEDVMKYKEKLNEYEDQMAELKRDIRKEVEGEASESYISALATVRGGNILRQKKQTQRSYETALSVLTSSREEANQLLQVKMQDNNNRYNRMFQMLQLQIQQEGTDFNQQMALLTAAQQIPEGRKVQLPDGTLIEGLKENDNLNVVQFTDSSNQTYVIGVDKKTGEEKYRTHIGQAKTSGGSAMTKAKALEEYEAGRTLDYIKKMDEMVESGDAGIEYDEDGKSFYYDKKAYEEAKKNDKWWTWTDNVGDPIDYRL